MPLLQILDWLRYLRLRRTLVPAHALGRRGEDVAHRYLQRKGYTVVARNFVPRSGRGDLDLVAWHQNRLVIVEVKARRNTDFAEPTRAITLDKERALKRVAREYARRTDTPWETLRFDVVSVVFEPRSRVEHLQDVFSLRD